MIKIIEVEETMEDLRNRADSLEERRLLQWVENSDLKLKLDVASKLAAELERRLLDTNKVNDTLMQKLDVERKVRADLDHRLVEANKLSETLHMEKLVALSRVQEQERTMENLTEKFDQLKEEKSRQWVENGALKLEMRKVKAKLSVLERQLQSSVLTDANRSPLDTSTSENLAHVPKLMNITRGESAEVLKLFNILELQSAEAPILYLGNDTAAHFKDWECNTNEMQKELVSLRNQKKKLEEQIIRQTNEARKLEDENVTLKLVQSKLVNRVTDLERAMEEKSHEISALVNKLDESREIALSQMEDLTTKVNVVLLDLEGLHAKELVLERQFESDFEEVKRLREENMALQEDTLTQIACITDEARRLEDENLRLQLRQSALGTRVTDLEKIIEQKSDQISVLVKKLLEEEKESASSQMEILMEKVKVLQQENSSKIEWENAAIKRQEDLTAMVKDLEQELNNVHHEKHIMEQHIESRDEKSVEHMNQIADHQEILKENERLAASIRDLELELDSVQIQKTHLEMCIERKNDECLQHEVQLENMTTELSTKSAMLERIQKEKETLEMLAKKLQDEVYYLCAEKSELALEIEKELQDASERLTQVENENLEHTSKISDTSENMALQENMLNQIASRTSEARKLEDGNFRMQFLQTTMQAHVTDLEKKIEERSDLISALINKLEEDKESTLSQMENLTRKVNLLQHDAEGLLAMELILERQAESEFEEVKRLRDENMALQHNMSIQIASSSNELRKLEDENYRLRTALQVRVIGLERLICEKTDEISTLSNKLEEYKEGALCQMESLTKKVNILQQDVKCLLATKLLLERQVESGLDEVKRMRDENLSLQENLLKIEQENAALKRLEDLATIVKGLEQELDNVHHEKHILELHIESGDEKAVEYMNQIEELNNKLACKTVDHQEMLKEKEHLEASIRDLELELDSVRIEKTHLEMCIERKNDEAVQHEVQLENVDSELSRKTIMLEKIQKEKETMESMVKKLQVEVYYLCAEKSELEIEMEKELQDATERQAQLENLNHELTNKISGQEILLKEKEAELENLQEEVNRLKNQIQSTMSIASEEHTDGKNENTSPSTLSGVRDLEMEVRSDLKELEEWNHMNFQKCILNNFDELKVVDKAVVTAVEATGCKIGEITSSSSAAATEKPGNLEMEVRKEQEEKKKPETEVMAMLEKRVRELEKRLDDKEQLVTNLEEEKREAIRQLCVRIDYHRAYSDQLKKLLLKIQRKTR